MGWIVEVDANVSNNYVAKNLLEQSPKVTQVEAVGGMQLRATVAVEDADAADADAASAFAQDEVAKRLNLLQSVSRVEAKPS